MGNSSRKLSNNETEPPLAGDQDANASRNSLRRSSSRILRLVGFGKGKRTMHVKQGTRKYRNHQTIKANMKATLQSNQDFVQLVQCPPGDDPLEWQAINAFVFYENADKILDCLMKEDVCTHQLCPTMSAGTQYTYLWQDTTEMRYVKPTELAALKYMECAIDWIFEQLSDPELFPQDDNAALSAQSAKTIKRIYKLIFRIYAHVFTSHYKQLSDIGRETEINNGFKHFINFVVRNKVLPRDSLAPLERIVRRVMPYTDIE